MLRRIKDYFFAPPIGNLAALHKFMSGEASYVAQRSTYEFSRNTLAWYGQHAFGDPAFNKIFAICRWESFAAILSEMLLLTRDWLIERGAGEDQRAKLNQALMRLYAAMLHEYPLPQHRPQGWIDVIEQTHMSLAERHDGAAQPADCGRAAAAKIFELLPVHSHNKPDDRLVIESAMIFGMIGYQDRLRRRGEAGELLSSLIEDNAQGQGPAP